MATTATPKSGNKGFKTEELIRRYFLQAGFFVCRGLKLVYDGDELTDIDIWIYERSATLARRRTIIDIKDKAKPQAAERMLFVMGMARLIGVEGCGVATTDRRKGLRELAQKQRLLWINGDDIQRLKKSPALNQISRLSEEDFTSALSDIDRTRGPKEFLSLFESAKSSLADRFGISSGNHCLDATLISADAAVRAHPNSPQAQALCRLTFALASMCAASFDYASAETALRPAEERQKFVERAIRYGADAKGFESRIKWMENAVSRYADGGSAIAKTVTQQVLQSGPGEEVKALAEIITKLSHDHRLFEAARGLEAAAYRLGVTSFRDLDSASASVLGGILDFGEIDRRAFADAVAATTANLVEDQANTTDKPI